MHVAIVAHDNGRSGHALEADEANFGVASMSAGRDDRPDAFLQEIDEVDRRARVLKVHPQMKGTALHVRFEERDVLHAHSSQKLVSV